jgi:hypothetical protein
MNLTVPQNLSKPVAALFAVGVILAIGAFIVTIAAIGALLGVTYAVILGALVLAAFWAASGSELRVFTLVLALIIVAVPTAVSGLFAMGVTGTGLKILLDPMIDKAFHHPLSRLPPMEWDVFWFVWTAFFVGLALIWLLLALIGRIRGN